MSDDYSEARRQLQPDVSISVYVLLQNDHGKLHHCRNLANEKTPHRHHWYSESREGTKQLGNSREGDRCAD